MKNILLTLFFVLSCAQAPKQKSEGYDKYLTQYAYPHETQTLTFVSQFQDLTMTYMDLGDSSKKEAVLLLHGKNFGGAYWSQTAEALVKDPSSDHPGSDRFRKILEAHEVSVQLIATGPQYEAPS